MHKSIGKTIANSLGIFFVSLLIFLGILGGYLAGSMLLIASEAPEVDSKELLSGLTESSKIVDQDGKLIKQIETAEFRKVIPYDKIPKDLVNAFVSAEDKRFWTHNGVDLFGIAAALKDLMSSGGLRGASTITMQLARNVYLNYDVNWTRKIQEMYLALQMEETLSSRLGKEEAKKKIMESYLNRIFFGQQAYGVEAAAEVYFSKPAIDLDLPQCATLASVVPAPSHYSLYSTYRPSQVTDERVLGETTINGERYVCVYNAPAYERSKYVLKEMLANGYITEDQYEKASKVDVAETIKPVTKQMDASTSYFTDLIRDQAIQLLMDQGNISEEEAKNKLFYGGLSITSTIDLALQEKLQQSISSINTSVNQTAGGASRKFRLNLNYDRWGNVLNANGTIIYFKKENLMDDQGRVVLPPKTFTLEEDGSLTIQPGRVRAYKGSLDITNFYTWDDNDVFRTHQVGSIAIGEDYVSKDQDGTIHISADYFKTSENQIYSIREDGALVINADHYTYDDVGVKQPQTAVTVLDTKTGEVRAIIGGREDDNSNFVNRAYGLPRSPGSSIKPIAEYTAALAQGYNQASPMDDVPISMVDGKPWPSNNNGRYQGIVYMKKAVSESLNPPAVRWLDKVGMKATKDALTRYGIINKDHRDRDHFIEESESIGGANDENLSLALGAMTRGLTTLDMANAYQAIGNNGKRIPALAISKIVDNSGKVYFENKHPETEVLNPQVNYQLLDMLLAASKQSWINPSIYIRGLDQGAKTGTTNDNKDYWCCITNPYYTTSVWVGMDNAQMSMASNSANGVTIYGRVAKILMEDKEPMKFEKPEGVYPTYLCAASGLKPGRYCKHDDRHPIIQVLCSKETEPKDVCDIHVSRLVDTRNLLLATSKTPEKVKGYWVFTQRKEPYDPQKFNGITPEDWRTELPTIYSNLGPVEPESSDSAETEESKPPEDKPGEAVNRQQGGQAGTE